MRKATFKYKYYGHGYDAAMVYLVYEYRGHEYTVFENRAKGNPPLAWQHGSEQALIDGLVEQENKPETNETIRYEDTADYAFDQLMRYWNGEPSDFDEEAKQ